MTSDALPYAEEQRDIEGIAQAFTMRRMRALLLFCTLHGLAEERSAIRRVIVLMIGEQGLGTDDLPLGSQPPSRRAASPGIGDG